MSELWAQDEKCPHCDGSGQTLETSGISKIDGLPITVYHDEPVICPECKGRGSQDE